MAKVRVLYRNARIEFKCHSELKAKSLALAAIVTNQILRLRLIYESFVNVAVRNDSMLVKAFSSKPLRLVHYSHPMLSDSSIRRLVRQRNISQRCRNQNASLVGLMRPTRLALRGRHRFPIGLSFLKHPEAGLSEVTCDGDFGFAVAPAGFNPLVKPADMTIPTAPRIEQCAIGRLDKSPLQIHIDIAPYRA